MVIISGNFNVAVPLLFRLQQTPWKWADQQKLHFFIHDFFHFHKSKGLKKGFSWKDLYSTTTALLPLHMVISHLITLRFDTVYENNEKCLNFDFRRENSNPESLLNLTNFLPKEICDFYKYCKIRLFCSIFKHCTLVLSIVSWFKTIELKPN